MDPYPSNPVVHLELHTGDPRGALGFYTRACGELGGGIVECPSDRPLWLPYVEVERIASATERARELGADVLLEPREGPAGWRSVVSAPAAGEIAFWQPKR
jgi:predicted enzyme related to lactoylglutathione lyase